MPTFATNAKETWGSYLEGEHEQSRTRGNISGKASPHFSPRGSSSWKRLPREQVKMWL